MALADEIQELANRTISALDASHDYYTYTKRVWRLLQQISYLDKLAKLGCPTQDEIEKLAEIKASRDVLVHNKKVANLIYVAKAGRCARYQEGETLEIPEHYHRASWETIKKVVRDVSSAAIKKVQHARP